MRVQGTSSRIGSGPRADRRKGAAGPFAPGGRTTVSAANVGVTALASVDALLTLQGVDGPESSTAAAVEGGEATLDGLADLQRELLAGEVDPRTLRDLRRRVTADSAATDDPLLQRTLRDIEVRAAVELAKLERAMPTESPAGAAATIADPANAKPVVHPSLVVRAYRTTG
ncbi:MAG: flagellar assembly protein FliX [Pseudomonadota bacterium]